jgi:hypothetical protein
VVGVPVWYEVPRVPDLQEVSHNMNNSFTFPILMYFSRQSKWKIPKITVDVLDKDLALTPTDVAGLWASITNIVEPGYFNSTAWYKSGTKTPRYVYYRLRQASILLVCKFVNQLTTGPPHSRNISASARLKYLNDMTARGTTKPDWPTPPSDILTASDHTAWEKQPLHYFTGYNSSGFYEVQNRLVPCSPPSPNNHEEEQEPNGVPRLSISSTPMEHATKHTGSPDSDDVSESIPHPAFRLDITSKKLPEGTGTCSRSQSPIGNTKAHNNTTDPTSNRDDSSCGDSDSEYDSDGDNLQVQRSCSPEDDLFTNDEYGQQGIAYYIHPETGQVLPKPIVNYNKDMGPSIDLEIPEDEILITDEMLARARAICKDEEDADLAAVAVVTQHEMAWEDITRRAIRQASLSGLGLASLAIEHLGTLGTKIDEHLIYWKRREGMVAATMQKLMDEQARVAQDAAMLAKLKADVIAQSHQLAEEQQKTSTAQRSVSNTATMATSVRASFGTHGVDKLRRKLHDSKRRTNPPNSRPAVSGFSGVRPVSGSAASLSLNNRSPAATVSNASLEAMPPGLISSVIVPISAQSTGFGQCSTPPSTSQDTTITSPTHFPSPLTPVPMASSAPGTNKIRDQFQLD